MDDETPNFSDIIEGKAEEYDTKRLKAFRRYFAMNERSGQYLNNFRTGQLYTFMHSVLDYVLKDCESELGDEEKERRRLMMHCLVNSANRSEMLRLRSDANSERCLRALLKLDWLRNETLACVVNLSRPGNGEEYYQIAHDLCTLWDEICEIIKKFDENECPFAPPNALEKAHEARSWILAIFSNYLERNDDFLATCDKIFELSVMDTVIIILGSLLDIECTIGNVKYILIFLERALKKFGIFEIGDEMEKEESIEYKMYNVVRIFVLIEVIRELASNEKYLSVLTSEATAQLILYVIEGILHYDYYKCRSAADTSTSGGESSERPQVELSPRNAANVSCVRNFAKALKSFSDVRLIEDIKLSCLEMLSILCSSDNLIREYIGRNDGISLLLRCMYMRDDSHPLARLYAIAGMRHLVLDCPSNQLRLAQLAQEPSAIIDRDGLLKNLGLRVVYDEKTKKIQLEPIQR